ncbi:type II secretion system protein N [Sphingomonas sp. BK235]|jgi:general secretion pathway protein C|uniref:type II secretion system protein N n=1 Tax=Sphingomonas sp. BK235 TaxID=2512131 RepID=UPI00104D0F33|nr:type II secretion system protein N [Sphingomonas sp. BK235]TCP37246.1 general secretion pathway protein C [Sphingomonas sp. BK235]
MRLKFDARARAILRRLPVVNAYSAVELLLLAGLAVQCARLMWVIVTPVSPLGAWVPAGPTIPSDPGGVLASIDPFYRVSGAQAAQGPAVVTSLQLTLFGTRMDSAQARGAAILAGPDGLQRSVSVGEEVAPGVVLRAVAFDHVTLERGGQREDLFLDQSTQPSPAPAPPAATSAEAPEPPVATSGRAPALPRFSDGEGGAMSPDRLRTDITAIPQIEGGRVVGLTVRGQGGNAFRASGLRDGDVVTQVAGRPVSGPADLDQFTRERAPGGAVPVTVQRNGQTVALSIPVK